MSERILPNKNELTKLAKGLGQAALDILTGRAWLPHESTSHGDHFTHPLDSPIEPITSLPNQYEVTEGEVNV